MLADRLAEARRSLPTLPALDEVCYVRPMKGNAGRRCGNCIMWFRDDASCAILPPKHRADADDVCNYHVPGAPMPGPRREHKGGIEYLDPGLAGFISGPQEGTKCGNCRFLDGTTCQVVLSRHGGPKAKVEPGGCCNRWQKG